MTLRSLLPLLVTAVALECAHSQGLFLRGNSVLNSLQSVTESTIPANGDLNPYGVAFVPDNFPSGGSIGPGDVLVSNFNAAVFNGIPNKQGTGTTIVSFTATGTPGLFATSSLLGLDTALGVLSRGFVLVGNLPVPGSTPGQGAIQVFDKNGNPVGSPIMDATLLGSPWDLTINDKGSTAQVFVSNALTGTITRLDVSVSNTGVTVNQKTQIGSGFGHQLITAIVVAGPTGLAYDADQDVLYVASTFDNKIYSIANAGKRTAPPNPGTGSVVFSDSAHLHGPLGLTLAPNGNLITANGDGVDAGGTPNLLVEFTPQGRLVATYQLDGGPPGAAFGVASILSHGSVRFAAVDNNLNTVTIWTLRSPSDNEQ